MDISLQNFEFASPNKELRTNLDYDFVTKAIQEISFLISQYYSNSETTPICKFHLGREKLEELLTYIDTYTQEVFHPNNHIHSLNRYQKLGYLVSQHLNGIVEFMKYVHNYDEVYFYFTAKKNLLVNVISNILRKRNCPDIYLKTLIQLAIENPDPILYANKCIWIGGGSLVHE